MLAIPARGPPPHVPMLTAPHMRVTGWTAVWPVAPLSSISETVNLGMWGGGPPIPASASVPVVIRRARRRRCGPPGVQVVPVHDCVEAEDKRPLRLPAPERADRERNHVTRANR